MTDTKASAISASWQSSRTKHGHADHVKALIEGGENREGNLKPAHAHCNLAKANEEKARKSKVARTRKKHIGITRPKAKMQSRGFTPTSKAERAHKPSLPPVRLYQEIER